MSGDDGWTEVASRAEGAPAPTPTHPRFSLEVVGGAAAARWEGDAPVCAIGSHPSNALVIDDRSVSRFHAEVRAEDGAFRIVDDESTNGTFVDGVRVGSAWLRDGSTIELGRVALRFHVRAGHLALPISERERFGSMVGRSTAMRAAFAVLERAAKSDATVLLEGETGTGKEAAAESLHAEGPRASGPFVVVDCSALPATLLESELFGHERGAFTGAVGRRIGAFEAASGGTIFLDEIGELPADLQPKLLRVLEQRTIRRVGSNDRIPVDVRVVAATHRSLRAMVNSGELRSDLYYRLAVVRVELPPLRARRGDMRLLVAELSRTLATRGSDPARLLDPSFLQRLEHGAWPGNVRELRNHLERVLVMDGEVPLEGAAAPAEAEPIDASMPYADARDRALARFEREYVPALLARHEGNVTRAARAAGIDRAYLYRLLRRHGLGREGSE